MKNTPGRRGFAPLSMPPHDCTSLASLLQFRGMLCSILIVLGCLFTLTATTAQADGSSSLWWDSGDPEPNTIDEYGIYLSAQSTGPFALIATVPGSQLFWQINNTVICKLNVAVVYLTIDARRATLRSSLATPIPYTPVCGSVPTPTVAPTSTAVPTKTAISTPTNTPTRTVTATPTQTATQISTSIPTKTATATATKTKTPIPTFTVGATHTATPVITPTRTPTLTATATGSGTPKVIPERPRMLRVED